MRRIACRRLLPIESNGEVLGEIHYEAEDWALTLHFTTQASEIVEPNYPPSGQLTLAWAEGRKRELNALRRQAALQAWANLDGDIDASMADEFLLPPKPNEPPSTGRRPGGRIGYTGPAIYGRPAPQQLP
jgi:hypothetical protein